MDLTTAFLLGLAGSLHCAGMCGPLAMALPLRHKTAPGFILARVAYNAGRIVTYCVLGLIFGFIGHTLSLAGLQRWLSITLGIVLVAGLFASRRLALWQPVTALVEELKSRMSALLRRRSFSATILLGLLNGLLPCGLVYVACAGASATGGLLSSAAYMFAFGLGTVPMLLAISLSGRLIPLRVRLKLRVAIPVSVLLLGTLLIMRGMSLGIPYVSPAVSAGVPRCCGR